MLSQRHLTLTLNLGKSRSALVVHTPKKNDNHEIQWVQKKTLFILCWHNSLEGIFIRQPKEDQHHCHNTFENYNLMFSFKIWDVQMEVGFTRKV